MGESKKQKTYYLDPFGCAKNQVDAETMMAFLNQGGWAAAEDPGDADVIIINSCGFIESAKRESINAALLWRGKYPSKKIILAGCLAQRYHAELAEALPEADLLFGNRSLEGIAEAAERLTGSGTPGTPAPCEPGGRPLLSLPGSAYVKISEGCNNRCGFCAIPLIRGSLRSRRIPEIVKECGQLLDRGVKELCLIGQDLGAFGTDQGEAALPALLEALSRLKGDFWVRLLYIHPDHFPFPILDIMEGDSRFLPYFDIPFQHASPGILAGMNRRGNAGAYLDLIARIRSRFPDGVIRSTFMTGFPGETGEDFALLLDFQEKARLDWMGVFTYSREEGAPAWFLQGRVSKKTAGERKRVLEERQVPITERQMDRFIGRGLEALVEERFEGGEEENLCLGRLFCQAPEVDGSAVIKSRRPLEPGSLIPVRVTARAGFDLTAVVSEQEEWSTDEHGK